jgi:hypothetical protein
MADDHLRPLTGGVFNVIDGVLVQVEGPVAGYPDPEPEPEPVPSMTPMEGGVFNVIDGILVKVEGPGLVDAQADVPEIVTEAPAPDPEPLAEEPLQ